MYAADYGDLVDYSCEPVANQLRTSCDQLWTQYDIKLSFRCVHVELCLFRYATQGLIIFKILFILKNQYRILLIQCPSKKTNIVRAMLHLANQVSITVHNY